MQETLGEAEKEKKDEEKEKKDEEKDKKEKEKEKEKEKKKEPEPNFQMLENPARVMAAQLKVLTISDSCRYQPFKPVSLSNLI